MRIIAGSSRGRALRAPVGRSTRPTSDRVREAIFDMLTSRGCFDDGQGPGEGPAVVDLFAGSGALGIEALSRGSRSAVFVESDHHAVATIVGNLHAAGLAEPEPGALPVRPRHSPAGRPSTRVGTKARVDRADVGRWVTGPGRADLATADLLFADPPYAFDGWPALLASVAASGFAGLAILEVGAEVDPGDRWDVVKVRAYGTTVVQLVRPVVLAGLRLEPKGGV